MTNEQVQWSAIFLHGILAITMPKPVDGVASWATDTLFVGGPEDGFNTKTVPADPAQGWKPNSIPGCEVQNWWQNLVGQWTAYLDAGDMEGDWTFAGDVDIAAGQTLTLEGGEITLGGGTGGIQLPNGTVDADTYYHEGPLPLKLPAALCLDPNGSHTKKLGASSGAVVGYTLAASANILCWPVPVPDGCIIASYAIYCRKRTNGSATIASRLWYTTGSNGIETAGSAGASNNANAPGYVTLAENTLLVAPAIASEQFYLVFTPSGSVTTNPDELFHAVVRYTRPAP